MMQLTIIILLIPSSIHAFIHYSIIPTVYSTKGGVPVTRQTRQSTIIPPDNTSRIASSTRNTSHDDDDDNNDDDDENYNRNGILYPNNKKNKKTTNKNPQQSTFWYAVPQSQNSLQSLPPCQPNLDSQGDLPSGSYRMLGSARTTTTSNTNYDDPYERKRTCLFTIALNTGIDSSGTRSSGTRSSTSSIGSFSSDNLESIMLPRIHQLIDSGFTSFQLPTPPSFPATTTTTPSLSLYNTFTNHQDSMTTPLQTWTEQEIYKRIIQNTPPSVLKDCNIGTRISIPSLTSSTTTTTTTSSFDQNRHVNIRSMVRQQIGDSILNMYGTTKGSLDSIQVNYPSSIGLPSPTRQNQQPTQHTPPPTTTTSPYTMDVLDALFDLQREGFIRSIHTLNFPSWTLNEIQSSFITDPSTLLFDSHQISCNMIDPSRYNSMYHYCHEAVPNRKENIVINNPLAGGLLTSKYIHIPDTFKKRKSGEPIMEYMSPSERHSFQTSLKQVWSRADLYKEQTEQEMMRRKKMGRLVRPLPLWQRFQNHLLMTLQDIAHKHEVSIPSVVLRWSIQLEQVESVVIGTNMNILDSMMNEKPFTRPRELRQVLTFELDEEDMNRLWYASGMKMPTPNDLNGDNYDDGEFPFDLSNQKLWL